MTCLEKTDVKIFNHGGTKQMGVNMFLDKDIYFFWHKMIF